MPTFQASTILIQEEPPRIRSLPSLPTATLAILGITERGPARTPVAITSFDDYVNIFGGYIVAGETTIQVRQFFLGGGRLANVSRVVHYTDIANNTTGTATRGGVTLNTGAAAPGPAILTGTVVGPWDFRGQGSGGTIIGTFGPPGAAQQGPSTATVLATAAQRDSVGGPFNLAGVPLTLTVTIDSGAAQAVSLLAADFVAPAAATTAEVAAAINRQIVGARATVVGATVRIASDRLGTGSGVNVAAGGANGVLAFTVGNIAGTGNVSSLGAVQFAELETVIETAWNVTDPLPAGNAGVDIVNNGGRLEIRTVDTGATVTLDLGAGTLNDELGFAADPAVVSGTSGAAVATLRLEGKYPGAYSGQLQVEIVNATSGVAAEFNLRLFRNALLTDAFENLSMDATAERYVERVIGGVAAEPRLGASELIRALDQLAAGTAAQRRPVNTALMPASPTLTAGGDGLAGIVDVDFIGDAAGQTGLNAFDTIDGIRLILSPDWTTAGMQNAMATYGEVGRRLEGLAILDPPAGLTAAGMVTYRNTLTASEHGAIYWPRVRVPNPSVAVFGRAETIVITPGGSIAGRMALNDSQTREGPFTQPANIETGALIGIVGLETNDVLREAIRDLIFPARINPIIVLPGRAVHTDGARTLRADGNFPSIGERRGVSDIEATIRAGLLFAKNRNNTPELREQVERTIRLYLIGRMRDGAFASTDPDTAFYVDASEALNPPSVRRRGILRVRIGLATNLPAEFLWITVTQDTRAVEQELLAP